jgi:hypothetical protein
LKQLRPPKGLQQQGGSIVKGAGMIVASLAVLATGTPCGQAIVTFGGNMVIPRFYVDTEANRYFLDTNQPFISDGHVDTWEFNAATTNQVQLVIYRQTGGSAIEVGRGEYGCN